MSLLDVIRSARGRLARERGLQAAAHALLWTCVADAVLLVLVTTVAPAWHSWLWLLAPPVVAVSFGLWTLVRRAPSDFDAAVALDRRLDLRDGAATATWLASSDGGAERAALGSATSARVQPESAMEHRAAAKSRIASDLACPTPRCPKRR